MPPLPQIAAYHDELVAIRHDIHRHPETAFEELRTAAIVAERLAAWGVEVHQGIGRTGVVGTLRSGSSARAVGLRADMDALDMEELNGFDHRSTVPGKMHGCGHDGHTAMLLGAARYLSVTRAFDGTVHFIFQPAEEGGGGAREMIDEGLFERFPVDGVYGLHNAPSLSFGSFAVAPGPVMACADEFRVTITGAGGHAAFPHMAVDPVSIAGEIIVALQSIVSRTIDPLESAVVSVTRLRAGDAANVIPESAEMVGSARALTPAVRDAIEAGIARLAGGIAAAHGASADIAYERGYPPTVNHAAESEIAARVAAVVAGAENVGKHWLPIMGSEDFSFMLEERPGCYAFIGIGEDRAMCHSPRYDFNDDILALGASYWVRLVETTLAP
jgi:hippurate hydrolase